VPPLSVAAPLRYGRPVKVATLIPLITMLLAVFSASVADGDAAAGEHIRSVSLARLPYPVSNNAVVSVAVGESRYVVSFAGLGSGKGHGDTLDVTLILDARGGNWRESVPLPGGAGRLAAAAAAVGELAYVFGGYTVEEDGAELSTASVHAFDPVSEQYTALSPIPVPVDDALAVTYQDRYIYLISGWHDLGNVNLVQRYDVETDSWLQATPIPGNALFGHAGGIVGNRIVYCDGVMIQTHENRSRDFVMSDACFLGVIDASDTRSIDWRRIPPHPGLPRYRMAAAGIPAQNGVLFIGGSENPYNYDGIGYNGEPSQPVSGALLFELASLSWREVSRDGPATMDHRGLVPYGGRWLVVGGMLAGQEVSDRVIEYNLGR
jgi:hypothetical protein